jgi:hypothetical protein
MVRKFIDNRSGQLLVLEAIIFSIMVFMALIFIYQLEPPERVSSEKYSNQLRIQGTDALRSIDQQYISMDYNHSLNQVEQCYSSTLVKYIMNKDVTNLTNSLDNLLPSSVLGYNIYLDNGTNSYLWYNGEEFFPKIDRITKASRIIVSTWNYSLYKFEQKHTFDNEFDTFISNNHIFSVVLEMWTS